MRFFPERIPGRNKEHNTKMLSQQKVLSVFLHLITKVELYPTEKF